MSKLVLRYPTIEDIPELKRVCLEPWAIDYGFVHYFETLLKKDVTLLIDFLPNMAKGIGIPGDHVPCTFMFAFIGERIVGRTSIRHELNENLRKDGGHIGYAVTPSDRQKGYATEILKQSLAFCIKELNLNEILITCDDDNIASIKTIDKNGGVLIDKLSQGDELPLKRRYEIKI